MAVFPERFLTDTLRRTTPRRRSQDQSHGRLETEFGATSRRRERALVQMRRRRPRRRLLRRLRSVEDAWLGMATLTAEWKATLIRRARRGDLVRCSAAQWILRRRRAECRADDVAGVDPVVRRVQGCRDSQIGATMTTVTGVVVVRVAGVTMAIRAAAVAAARVTTARLAG